MIIHKIFPNYSSTPLLRPNIYNFPNFKKEDRIQFCGFGKDHQEEAKEELSATLAPKKKKTIKITLLMQQVGNDTVIEVEGHGIKIILRDFELKDLKKENFIGDNIEFIRKILKAKKEASEEEYDEPKPPFTDDPMTMRSLVSSGRRNSEPLILQDERREQDEIDFYRPVPKSLSTTNLSKLSTKNRGNQHE